MGPPLIIVTVLAVLYARFGDIETLGRILAGITAAAVGLLIAVVAKMAAPLFLKRWDWAPVIAIAAFIGVAIMQWPLPLVFAGAGAGQRRVRVGDAMNDNPLIALAGYFALLSLFAVGGANAAIPEMHRIAVEVMHWMSDRQFADMFRDRAGLARAEHHHRHFDRISRRWFGRRRRGNGGDVRADLRAGVFRRAHLGPLQGRALAHRDPGRPGAGLAGADRGERLRAGAQRRP